MPFVPSRVLPQTSLIDPGAISVPSNFRPVDTSKSLIAFENLKLANRRDRREQEDFEFRKAKAKTDLLGSVTRFAATSGSGGQSSPSGLKGHTPFSTRVMNQVNEQVASTLKLASSTDDLAEVQNLVGSLQASLAGNPDYQKALQQDALIDQQLAFYGDPENREDFDTESVVSLLADIRRNTDPITGLVNENGAAVTLNEKILGTNTRPFDIETALTDLQAATAAKPVVQRTQVGEDGTIGVVTTQQGPTRAEIATQVDNLLNDPRALRAAQLRYGVTDRAALTENITSRLADNAALEVDRDDDGTPDASTRVTAINQLQDPLSQEVKRLQIESTKSLIRSRDALTESRLKNATGVSNDTGLIGRLRDPKKFNDAAREIGDESGNLVYNLNGVKIVNETSEAIDPEAETYGLIKGKDNAHFEVRNVLGAVENNPNLQEIEGTLYTTNRDAAELAEGQGMTVTTAEKPNSISGVNKFNNVPRVYSIQGVKVNIPSDVRQTLGPPSPEQQTLATPTTTAPTTAPTTPSTETPVDTPSNNSIPSPAQLTGDEKALSVVELEESSGGTNVINREDSNGLGSIGPLQYNGETGQKFLDYLGIDGYNIVGPISEVEKEELEELLLSGGRDELIQQSREFFRRELLPEITDLVNQELPQVDLKTTSSGIKTALYDTQVNHGTSGRRTILKNASEALGRDPTDIEIIEAIQTARRNYVSGLSSLSDTIKEKLIKRYDRVEEKAKSQVNAKIFDINNFR